jgi:hypothetical protein
MLMMEIWDPDQEGETWMEKTATTWENERNEEELTVCILFVLLSQSSKKGTALRPEAWRQNSVQLRTSIHFFFF